GTALQVTAGCETQPPPAGDPCAGFPQGLTCGPGVCGGPLLCSHGLLLCPEARPAGPEEPGDGLGNDCEGYTDEGVSHTLFLNRDGVTVRGGAVNDSSIDQSTLLAPGVEAFVPPWDLGDDLWAEVRDCVKAEFAPFDIAVTDVRPPPSVSNV